MPMCNDAPTLSQGPVWSCMGRTWRHTEIAMRTQLNHGQIQGGRGPGGPDLPFLAHDVGFLTLGPKLDPFLDPPFLLVDLRWTLPFRNSLIRPCKLSIPLFIEGDDKKIMLFGKSWSHLLSTKHICSLC